MSPSPHAHWIRRAGWLAFVLPLGCISVPENTDTAPGLPVPDGWAEHAAAKPIADATWVSTFSDPSLTQLVNAGLEGNRDLGRLSARIKSAEAEVAIAGGAARPQVSGGLNGDRSQRNFIGFPSGSGLFGLPPGQDSAVFSTLANTFDLTLNLRWELDIWGRIRAGQKATLEQLSASRCDFEAARLSLAGQLCRTWFQLAAARERVGLAAEALQVFEETARVVEVEFREGIEHPGRDTGSELSLAKVDAATARSTLTARQEILPALRRRLEVLMGQYPDGALRPEGPLPGLPGIPPAGIPAQVLERRPDLVAAERRLASADFRVLEAQRSLLPAISLTSSYGTSSPELSRILDGDLGIWNLAGNLTQPLLDGQRLRQAVKAREADVDFALADYQQAALTAFQEVEDALARERFLSAQQGAIAEAVRLADEAMRRSREAYAAGTGDVLTMLNAQQRVITAKSSLIDIKLQRLENRIDLHLALGGDFRTGDQ